MKKKYLILFIYICFSYLFINLVYAADEETVEEDKTIYKIIFDFDDGIPTVETQNLQKGSNIVPPENEPQMENYHFVLWAKDSPFVYGKYVLYGYFNSNFPKWPANDDITFYAVWRSEKNAVRFDANGGKIDNKDYVESKYIKFKRKYGVIYPSKNPSLNGKEFLGWTFGDSSCNNEKEIYGGSLRSDVTFAYGWKEITDRVYYACWKEQKNNINDDISGNINKNIDNNLHNTSIDNNPKTGLTITIVSFVVGFGSLFLALYLFLFKR